MESTQSAVALLLLLLSREQESMESAKLSCSVVAFG